LCHTWPRAVPVSRPWRLWHLCCWRFPHCASLTTLPHDALADGDAFTDPGPSSRRKTCVGACSFSQLCTSRQFGMKPRCRGRSLPQASPHAATCTPPGFWASQEAAPTGLHSKACETSGESGIQRPLKGRPCCGASRVGEARRANTPMNNLRGITHIRDPACCIGVAQAQASPAVKRHNQGPGLYQRHTCLLQPRSTG